MFWLVLWLVVAVVTVVSAMLPMTDVPRHVRVGEALARRWRRWHPGRPEPTGAPIENIAATLRRLQDWLDAYADPQPIPGKATKVTATANAYDRVLVEACHALDVPEGLDGTAGIDREAERLRMQSALVEAGLVLRGTSISRRRTW
jgi:hypothetical protein